MSVGRGRLSRSSCAGLVSSSSMISLQRSMHSSQMYTPGPAISFFTCFWLFPQKEHFSRSDSPNLAMFPLPFRAPAAVSRVGRLSRAVGADASYLCSESAAAQDLVDAAVVL